MARLIECCRETNDTNFHAGTVLTSFTRTHLGTIAVMKTLRRFLVALSLAGTIAGVLRMRGKGGVPPQEGGWREVSVPSK